MFTPISKDYLFTEEEKKKYKINEILEYLDSAGGNHNFAVVSEEGKPIYARRAVCTGGLSRLYDVTFLKDKTIRKKNIAFISRPYTGHGTEYLNLLLHPDTSPYRFWMNPKDYKVVLDKKGNIDLWACINPEKSIGEVYGLAILERINSQHNPKFFFDVWKKSKLPFAAFFYLQHLVYNGFSANRFRWKRPTVPYSAFNMWHEGFAYPKNPKTYFNAPRVFQSKPNLVLGNSINQNMSIADPSLGCHYVNSIWQDTSITKTVKLTQDFEAECFDLLDKYYVALDSYGRVVGGAKSNFDPSGKKDYSWLKDSEACRNYNEEVIDKYLEILNKYVPLFMKETI